MAGSQSAGSKERDDHRCGSEQRSGSRTQITNCGVLLVEGRTRDVIRGPRDLSLMADPLVGHGATDLYQRSHSPRHLYTRLRPIPAKTESRRDHKPVEIADHRHLPIVSPTPDIETLCSYTIHQIAATKYRHGRTSTRRWHKAKSELG